MVLDLKPYQAAAPYPALQSVHADKALAAVLAGGYSGEKSELTTVFQYAYHSLKLQKSHPRISEVLRGVFFVETLHLRFMGDCVWRLGGDAQYMVALDEKSIFWQASLVNYESTPQQMLLADIQSEKYAAEFYRHAGKTITQPDIAGLMLRLAEDEELHIKIFTELYKQSF